MSAAGIAGTVAQVGTVAGGAPGVIGAMRQVRARLEGRAGPGAAQPYRDLRKLLTKEQLVPEGTTVVFAWAPAVIAAAALVTASIVPLATLGSPMDQAGDLFAVVGLLLMGTVALILAGLDTGTAFGGMGASREATIAALVEPTILLAVFALSVPANSSNLSVMVADTTRHAGHVLSPAGALAFAALVVVVIAETGRLPVDNPSTHLELTMVHEAMVLEYSGPKLAVIEWGAAMRLTVLLGVIANLFVPWGIAAGRGGALDVFIGLVAIGAKITVAAVALATVEVFLAKIRLFRVPELLAGSFLLALLAVTASYFLVGQPG